MKKFMNFVMFFLFTYPAGIVIGLIFWTLRFVRVLELNGWENFPKQKGKILFVSNHPYKGEQFLVPGLFFPLYVLQPKYGPWSVVDRKNYYDKWWAIVLRPRLIPVDRTLQNGDVGSLAVARSVLESGANIIIFPEGGRTKKGKAKDLLTSRTGRMLRRLKVGFAYLATEVPGVTLLPVWCEFDSWSVRITIGRAENFYNMNRKEVVQITEGILLKLADHQASREGANHRP